MLEGIEEEWRVIFNRCASTGRVKGEYWYKRCDDPNQDFWPFAPKGWMRESPPGDRPQTILYDEQGRPVHLTWRKNNEDHREHGPAWLVVNPDNGVRVIEQYCVNGKVHRADKKPAYIHRNPHNGEVIKLEYYEHGVQRFWKKSDALALKP